MRRAWRVTRRSVVAFYRDQGTHHAAALTYYALMSVFPMLLLEYSLLGVIGQYPATYNTIVHHLRGVVPAVTLAPLSTAVMAALKDRGTAAAALGLAIATAIYGGTGYLKAARRADDAIFDARRGRSFVRRKLTDSASLLLLLALVLVTLVLTFAGGDDARNVLGSAAGSVWRVLRSPGAFASALLDVLLRLLRDRPTSASAPSAGSCRGRSSAWRCGSPCRRPSTPTSTTSRASTSPTAPSPPRSSCSCGCG